MFQTLLLLTALLAVAVLLRRLKTVEARQAQKAGGNKKSEDEQDALAAVGALTCDIANMVLSPVTIIQGQCELARIKGESDRRLETIEREARRIANVVERFRGLGREHRDEVQEVDPVACAQQALRSLSGLVRERDVTVHETVEPVPRIETNPFLLTHALRHLLKAAIQAAPEEVGDVTMAVGLLPTKGDAKHVAFAVADDGPGIPPEQLPFIFHPYPNGSSGVRGECLAYAVVYAVAHAMGATVVVNSAPGAGTQATLKVPLRRSAPYAEPEMSVAVPHSAQE
ncbi:MAG: sensor histidine kinase [Planctomycetota bacterium]|jgi:signal transduction histidine kinase